MTRVWWSRWRALGAFDWRALARSPEPCALCRRRLVVRVHDSELGVRCLTCGASAITQSLVDVLEQVHAGLDRSSVYDLSAAGALVRYLRRRAGVLTTSEWLDGVPSGTVREGVLIQDVEQLSFADDSFDVCTSTEVFEHVGDDLAGFREIHRVLKPGGWFVFSVPMFDRAETRPRARRIDGRCELLLPAEFHADRYRGPTVLVFREYGRDIVDRLRTAGFDQTAVRMPGRQLFGQARPIVVARKGRPGA